MRLKVEKYYGDDRAHRYLHKCYDSDTDQIHHVDLMVYGNFDIQPEDLVGKTIDVDYLFPSIELAMNPRIVEGEAKCQ